MYTLSETNRKAPEQRRLENNFQVLYVSSRVFFPPKNNPRNLEIVPWTRRTIYKPPFLDSMFVLGVVYLFTAYVTLLFYWVPRLEIAIGFPCNWRLEKGME